MKKRDKTLPTVKSRSYVCFVLIFLAFTAWIIYKYYHIFGWELTWFESGYHPFFRLREDVAPRMIIALSLLGGTVLGDKKTKLKALGLCYLFTLVSTAMLPAFWSHHSRLSYVKGAFLETVLGGIVYCCSYSALILAPFAVSSAITGCIKWICLNHGRVYKAITKTIAELHKRKQLFSTLLFFLAIPACIAWIVYIYHSISGWTTWYLQSNHDFWALLRSRIPLVISVFSLAAGIVNANRMGKARLLAACYGFLLLTVFIIPMMWSFEPFLETLLVFIEKAVPICATYTLCIVPSFFLPKLFALGIDRLNERLNKEKIIDVKE